MSDAHTEYRQGLTEELGWLKVLIVLAASLEFSLVGWIGTTSAAITSAELVLRGLASLLSGYVGLLSIWIFWRAAAILRQLKGEFL